MKIRIKNIFVNKDKIINKNEELDRKVEASIKVTKNCNEKINSSVDNIENIEKENDLDMDVDVAENIISKNNKKVRAGRTSKKNKKENKLYMYFNNLFRNKNNLSKSYYVLLFAMVLLGGGSIYIASKTYSLFNKEEYSVYSSTNDNNESDNLTDNDNVVAVNMSVEEQSNLTSNFDTISEIETSNKNDSNNANVTNNQVVKKVEPLKFIKPIDGEIQKIYSDDKVIYSKTLELWKIHDGIDVSAEIGTYVKAIEKGTIEKVYDDSFLGVTIVINHGQGYKSSYSNLNENTLVKEGQKIVKGQKIGKIGKTAIGEIKDEPHMHFMLYENDNVVDPTYIFK